MYFCINITASQILSSYLSVSIDFQLPRSHYSASKIDRNLKRYNIHPKERLPSGHTLPLRTCRTANRVRSGQAATPAAKHLWGYRESKNCMCGAATCDLNHIMTSCTHFGERPSLDGFAEMKDGYVRWLSAVVVTTYSSVFLSTCPNHLSPVSLIFATHTLALMSSFLIFSILFIHIVHLNSLMSVPSS